MILGATSSCSKPETNRIDSVPIYKNSESNDYENVAGLPKEGEKYFPRRKEKYLFSAWTDDDYLSIVKYIPQEKPRLFYFTASWCKPCKEAGPLVEQAAKIHSSNIVFIIIHVDKKEELNHVLTKTKVKQVPQIIFNDKRYLGLKKIKEVLNELPNSA